MRTPFRYLAAVPVLGLLWSGPAVAAEVEAYANLARLVENLYLYPEEVTPHDLLYAGGRGLMDKIDWLMVESTGTDVQVLHGNGAAIGAVSVGSWEGLPDALTELEQVVTGSGYPVGDVDVRLEILLALTDALDRYSKVLHGEGKERFGVRLSGEYEGIGATMEAKDGHLVVTEVVDEGPAAQSGLKDKDQVLRIDGKSTVGMPVAEAVRLVRGEVGTQVVLSVLRAGTELDVAITRAVVTEPNVKHRVLADGVGYLAISHVSQRTVENLQSELARLVAEGGADRGLVVDLRGNTGGSMKEAARAADMFLTEGLLLRTEGPDGGRVQNLQAEMQAEALGDEPDVPIVIVVDDRTASGSEIFAGALVELGRAAVVGTRTYGKGTVQKIYRLDDATELKLTVAQYVLANGRLIADVGIVPDVVVGRVELDSYGVRFRDFDEAAQGVGFGEIVPEVVERPGSLPPVDVPVEIARRAVLAAKDTTRAEALRAVRVAAAEVREEQEAHLVEALARRQVDWAPAVVVDPDAAAEAKERFLDARATVTVAVDPARSDVFTVKAVVQNLEDVPLHRVLVELDCPSFYAWNDVVVPVGRVLPGATGKGEVAVALPPGIDPREDLVTVRIRAEGRPPLLHGEEIVSSKSTPAPTLGVSARLVPHAPGVHRAEITVQNLATHAISGVEARFAYPFGLDAELLDLSAVIPVLSARGSERFDLTLELGPNAPAVLPLDLEIETERYRTLVEWPLGLPVDGTPVALQAPVVKPRVRVLSAPIGRFGLPLIVTDESRLDHVVVYANGKKVLWTPGGKSVVELRPEVELFQGANTILVVAEDEQGVRQRQWFTVRGESPRREPESATVDATEP